MIISDIQAKKLALFEYGKKIFDHIRDILNAVKLFLSLDRKRKLSTDNLSSPFCPLNKNENMFWILGTISTSEVFG